MSSRVRVARKVPRFKVKPHFPVSVSFLQAANKTFHLKTLGEQGFGFYSAPRDAKLIKLSQVDICFKSGAKSLQIPGTIQYSIFLPNLEGGVNFIGVQFLFPNSKLLKAIQIWVRRSFERGYLA